MKHTFLIILFIILNNTVFSQRQVDLDPYIFLNNIKQKVFKVKRIQPFEDEDIYVDLNTNSYIKTSSYPNKKKKSSLSLSFKYTKVVF